MKTTTRLASFLSASILAPLAVTAFASSAGASELYRWSFDTASASGCTVTPTVGPFAGVCGSSAYNLPGLTGQGVRVQSFVNEDLSPRVTFPATVGALGLSDFTIGFWYRTGFRVAGKTGDVAGNREQAGYGNYVSLCVRGTGELVAEVDQDATGAYHATLQSGNVKVNDDAWHPIALTRQGAVLFLYVDAVPVAGLVAVKANLTGQYPFRIGRSYPVLGSGLTSAMASFDTLTIRNDALTVDGVRALAAQTGLRQAPEALARRFSPALRLSGSMVGYPMSAQTFFDQAVAGSSDPELLDERVQGRWAHRLRHRRVPGLAMQGGRRSQRPSMHHPEREPVRQ